MQYGINHFDARVAHFQQVTIYKIRMKLPV